MAGRDPVKGNEDFWWALNAYINAQLRAALPIDADPVLYYMRDWGVPASGWHVDQLIYQRGSEMEGVPAYYPAKGCHIRGALPWPIDVYSPGMGIPWGGRFKGHTVKVPSGSMMLLLGERTMHSGTPAESDVPRRLFSIGHAIYGNPPNRR